MATITPGEQVELWRPAGLPGVEVMRGEGGSRLWRWYHEAYAVCTVHAGTSEYRYRQATHTARPGDSVMMEPGEVHADLRVEGPTSFHVLFVSPEALRRFRGDEGGGALHLRAARSDDAAFFGAASSLHAALERGAPALEVQCRLGLLLDDLATRFAEPAATRAQRPPGAAALLRARDLLHASPGRAVSLDELAAAAGLSKFHLLRAFAKHFGVPPHTYHTQLRIATARTLLADGVPISRVALETGFADQSHLTRHFAREVGVTPGAYARNIRGTAWSAPEPCHEELAVVG